MIDRFFRQRGPLDLSRGRPRNFLRISIIIQKPKLKPSSTMSTCKNAANDVNNALYTCENGLATLTIQYGPYLN
jgi:hypothetical protein